MGIDNQGDKPTLRLSWIMGCVGRVLLKPTPPPNDDAAAVAALEDIDALLAL